MIKGVISKKFIVNLYFLSTSLAYAEEKPLELPPLIVTESKTINSEIDNQFEEQALIERGIGDIKDVIYAIPNVHIADLGMGSSGNVFSVRGLTNTQIFSEPSMVFYIDDVPYSSTMAYLGHFFDIESIDVYRSPQAGLFGKNSYGGVFNLKSQTPENKLKARVALELAEYEHYLVTAKASGALINDELYFNIGGTYKQREGFLYNEFLNITPDNVENFSGNMALTWIPNQNLEIRLSAGLEDFDFGASRFVRLDSTDFYTVNSNDEEQLQQRSDYQALRVAYQFKDSELLSVSSRKTWKMQPREADLDLTPVSILTRQINIDEETLTQEFRWSSTLAESDWDWNLGGFFSNRQRTSFVDTLALGRRVIFDIKLRETESYAVFGHLAYQGFDDLTLKADLRFDYVKNELNKTGSLNFPTGKEFPAQLSNNSSYVSPTFGIDYNYSPNVLIYAATGLAFKAGGFSGTSFDFLEFKKETLWHNELGFKTNAFNQRLQANLTLFYYEIEDYQIETFLSQVEYAITNAPEVESYGVEIETKTAITDNLRLDANLGYTHAQFKTFKKPISQADYAGNSVPFVPDFNALVALQYKHPQGYFARAEWRWVGDTYSDSANSEIMHENDYSLANLRIGYKQSHYSIYAFANNITDNRYYTRKLRGVNRGTPSDPRVIGVRLEVSY